mmetsp:Transcript_17357/g.25482  ORF Transcript_17357/g.25482 Transcript_17357/m.25482 type:complete len:439 (+) Transcript_17357:53-1369(+)|eukprot:CAMPEP_0195525634 /NCGR_PEP_ID=MMETSP0794_2-20130614/26154_1 /TAXON_ID=515487 /ORGANISM="Stephanopyxis turris, Strain CCMP 815" /LENGTH=438 /DNA_ID=CAMNT_0040656127 /DNA_START=53 /DNA_END=1369 /DNA_ORIENTATION=-
MADTHDVSALNVPTGLDEKNDSLLSEIDEKLFRRLAWIIVFAQLVISTLSVYVSLAYHNPQVSWIISVTGGLYLSILVWIFSISQKCCPWPLRTSMFLTALAASLGWYDQVTWKATEKGKSTAIIGTAFHFITLWIIYGTMMAMTNALRTHAASNQEILKRTSITILSTTCPLVVLVLYIIARGVGMEYGTTSSEDLITAVQNQMVFNTTNNVTGKFLEEKELVEGQALLFSSVTSGVTINLSIMSGVLYQHVAKLSYLNLLRFQIVKSELVVAITHVTLIFIAVIYEGSGASFAMGWRTDMFGVTMGVFYVACACVLVFPLAMWRVACYMGNENHPLYQERLRLENVERSRRNVLVSAGISFKQNQSSASIEQNQGESLRDMEKLRTEFQRQANTIANLQRRTDNLSVENAELMARISELENHSPSMRNRRGRSFAT